VDRETADALAAINRAFYRERAEEFGATREDPWPGWQRVLECLEAQPLPEPLRVLDLGCGNGRFASFLDQHLATRRRAFRYVGVDASEALLERARRLALSVGRVELVRADWVETAPERALPAGPFSLAVLFGVLHHVPGRARRRALVTAAARRLGAGGLLALSTWQFQAHGRFRRRLVAWDDYNRRAARPIDPAELEPGDHLLRWGDADAGIVRYCHFANVEETDALTEGLDLERVDAFRADGREGDLNRYLVLRAGP
jgi:SAM-dependent methyltransferase